MGKQQAASVQRLLFYSSLTRPFLRQGDKQEIVDLALLQMLNMVAIVWHADPRKHLYRLLYEGHPLYEAPSPHGKKYCLRAMIKIAADVSDHLLCVGVAVVFR